MDIQIAPYSLCSALDPYRPRSKGVHSKGNRVPSGTQVFFSLHLNPPEEPLVEVTEGLLTLTNLFQNTRPYCTVFDIILEYITEDKACIFVEHSTGHSSLFFQSGHMLLLKNNVQICTSNLCKTSQFETIHHI